MLKLAAKYCVVADPEISSKNCATADLEIDSKIVSLPIQKSAAKMRRY
jgi:hypothetical protein